MVSLLAPLEGLAVCFFLYPLLGRAVGIRSFSWDLTNHDSARIRALIVCDTLHISLAPLLNCSNVGQALYTLLAFEASGVLTAAQINEDGLWQAKHGGGSQLLLALLDSLGNSGGTPPSIFTVASGLSHCLSTISPPTVIPTVTTNATHLEPRNSCHLSITGGIPPYTIIFASPGTPILQYLAAPQRPSTFSLTNNVINLSGSAIAVVRDSSGMFGQITDFVESTDDGEISCEAMNPQGRSRKLIVARSSVKINPQDKIVVAVCTSIGGTITLAGLCFAVVVFRHRKRGLVAGQDARPRPFDAAPPASRTNTSPPRVNVSVPLSVIDISWRNNWVVSPTDASSTRSPVVPTSPSRTHVPQLPAQAASRQPSNTSLRSPEDSRSQPPRKPSNSSMNVIQSSQTHPSSQLPRQQQSISSMRSANNNHLPTNLPLAVQRSTPMLDGLTKSQSRSEGQKRVLHLSRSTGDIHDNSMAYPQRQHQIIPRSMSHTRDPNQLRSYHSTSNIRHARAPEIVHQRHDRIDPPPYHKLKPSGR